MSYYFGKYNNKDGSIRVAGKVNEANGKSNEEFIKKTFTDRGFNVSVGTGQDGTKFVNGKVNTGDLTGKFQLEAKKNRDKDMSIKEEAKLLEGIENKKVFLENLDGKSVFFNAESGGLTEINKVTIGNILKFENNSPIISGNLGYSNKNGETSYFISNSIEKEIRHLDIKEYEGKRKALGFYAKETDYTKTNEDGTKKIVKYINFSKNIKPSNPARFKELVDNKRNYVDLKGVSLQSLITGNNLFLNDNVEIVQKTKQKVEAEVERPKKTAKKEAVKVVKEEPKAETKKSTAKVEKPKAEKKVEAKKETKPKAKTKALYSDEADFGASY